MFHPKSYCIFSWGWKWWLSLRCLKCLFAPENGIFSSTGNCSWIERYFRERNTRISKKILKKCTQHVCLIQIEWMLASYSQCSEVSFGSKLIWSKSQYRDHARSAIDSDIMIDRVLHCTFFVRVLEYHAVLSKWKSTVISLLTAEIALLLVTGTLLKARQGCKRSKR